MARRIPKGVRLKVLVDILQDEETMIAWGMARYTVGPQRHISDVGRRMMAMLVRTELLALIEAIDPDFVIPEQA